MQFRYPYRIILLFFYQWHIAYMQLIFTQEILKRIYRI